MSRPQPGRPLTEVDGAWALSGNRGGPGRPERRQDRLDPRLGRQNKGLQTSTASTTTPRRHGLLGPAPMDRGRGVSLLDEPRPPALQVLGGPAHPQLEQDQSRLAGVHVVGVVEQDVPPHPSRDNSPNSTGSVETPPRSETPRPRWPLKGSPTLVSGRVNGSESLVSRNHFCLSRRPEAGGSWGLRPGLQRGVGVGQGLEVPRLDPRDGPPVCV